MDTLTIAKLGKEAFKTFLGCYAIDELQKKNLLEKLCNGLGRRNTFVIFNLDPSHMPGSHWLLFQALGDNSYILFDTFGANSLHECFHFRHFGSSEKFLNQNYTEKLHGQIFQYKSEELQSDLECQNNEFRIFLYNKDQITKIRYKELSQNNATKSLNYLLIFLNRLCFNKTVQKIYYNTSQIQPKDTITCGELCMIVADIINNKILYRHFDSGLVCIMLNFYLKRYLKSIKTSTNHLDFVKKYMFKTFGHQYNISLESINKFKGELKLAGIKLRY